MTWLFKLVSSSKVHKEFQRHHIKTETAKIVKLAVTLSAIYSIFF